MWDYAGNKQERGERRKERLLTGYFSGLWVEGMAVSHSMSLLPLISGQSVVWHGTSNIQQGSGRGSW